MYLMVHLPSEEGGLLGAIQGYLAYKKTPPHRTLQ